MFYERWDIYGEGFPEAKGIFQDKKIQDKPWQYLIRRNFKDENEYKTVCICYKTPSLYNKKKERGGKKAISDRI